MLGFLAEQKIQDRGFPVGLQVLLDVDFHVRVVQHQVTGFLLGAG